MKKLLNVLVAGALAVTPLIAAPVPSHADATDDILDMALILAKSKQVQVDLQGRVDLSGMSDEDAKEFLTETLKRPEKVSVWGMYTKSGTNGTFEINPETFKETLKVAYGNPQDVKDNDQKGDQYRFLGFTESSTPYNNMDFPEDEAGENDITKRDHIYRPWEHPEDVDVSSKNKPVAENGWLTVTRMNVLSGLPLWWTSILAKSGLTAALYLHRSGWMTTPS